MGIKLLDPIVNKVKHGSTWLKSKSINETLTWFETSWKGNIKFLPLLSREFSSIIEKLISSCCIDEIEQEQHLIDSLSVHLRCEERISILNWFHFIVKSLVSDDSNSSIDACLDFYRTKTEHRQNWPSLPVVLWACERLSHIFYDVNIPFFQEWDYWLEVILYTEEVCKKNGFSLNHA